MIRQHCPTNRNPTCHHFTATLKSNIWIKLSTPVGRGANCEEDDNEAIIDFEDLFPKSSKANQERHLPEQALQQSSQKIFEDAEALVLPATENADAVFHLPDECEFPDDDDAELLQIENRLFETFKKQATVYVAGYLASVVVKKCGGSARAVS